ncbi:hypothetical protein D3C71_1811780 [compost metagenome]
MKGNERLKPKLRAPERIVIFTGPGEMDMDNEYKHMAIKMDIVHLLLQSFWIYYSLSGITPSNFKF